MILVAGKYARVGTMLAKESVRKRMESESGISYTEFTYQLLQVGGYGGQLFPQRSNQTLGHGGVQVV